MPTRQVARGSVRAAMLCCVIQTSACEAAQDRGGLAAASALNSQMFASFFALPQSSRGALIEAVSALSFATLAGAAAQLANQPQTSAALEKEPGFAELQKAYPTLGAYLQGVGAKPEDMSKNLFDAALGKEPDALAIGTSAAVMATVAAMTFATAYVRQLDSNTMPSLALTPYEPSDIGTDNEECSDDALSSFTYAVNHWASTGMHSTEARWQATASGGHTLNVQAYRVLGSLRYDELNADGTPRRSVLVDMDPNGRVGSNGITVAGQAFGGTQYLAQCVLDRFRGIATAAMASYLLRSLPSSSVKIPR